MLQLAAPRAPDCASLVFFSLKAIRYKKGVRPASSEEFFRVAGCVQSNGALRWEASIS